MKEVIERHNQTHGEAEFASMIARISSSAVRERNDKMKVLQENQRLQTELDGLNNVSDPDNEG